MADDYDQLSDLGRVQARALGEELLAAPAPSAIFVGPRVRQRDTHAEVAALFEARGVALPAAVTLAELDEHAGQAIFFEALGTLPGSAGPLGAAVDRLIATGLSDRGVLISALALVLKAWGRGELPSPAGLETFAAFRARVREALERMAPPASDPDAAVGPVWAFTSAGFIAAAVGEALALAAGPAVELAFHVENGSLTELHRGHPLSDTPFALKRFNQVHHLAPDQLTNF